MASLLELQREINRLENKRLRNKRDTRKLRELEAKRKEVQKHIEKIIRTTGRLGKSDLSGEITRDIENKINKEQWMEKIIRARFRKQAARSTGSPRWQRLKPATVKDRIAQGFPGPRPILIRTGALFGGALAAVKNTFSLRKPIDWDVNDIDVEYAKYHQTGTSRMVARPFFSLPNSRELEPVLNRVRQLLRQKFKQIAKGK